MSALTLYALAGSAAVGIGFYGLIASRHLLRRIVAFNLIGSGVFLYFGATGARDGAVDAVPQALIITGIVVALSASALAVGLLVAHVRASGNVVLPEDESGA
jgi:multicomponent Na+:H+ antiporter subunit C